MEKVQMVTKSDGKIKVVEVNSNIEEGYYYDIKDKFLNNFLDYGKIDYVSFRQPLKLRTIRKDVSIMIDDLLSSDDFLFLDVVSIFKNIRNCEEIKVAINYIISTYKKQVEEKDDLDEEKGNLNRRSVVRRIDNTFLSDFDVLAYVVIKNVINSYYLLKLNSLKREDIMDLKIKKSGNMSLEDLLFSVDNDFSDISMDNGMNNYCYKVLSNKINSVFDELNVHKCWDNCACATPSKCPKIKDKIKKNIDDYDFITSGYQIFDSNGQLDKFIVSDCTKYERESERRVDKTSIKNAKETLACIYFDASDIKEALTIQEDLLNRGHLGKYGENAVSAVVDEQYINRVVKRRR